MFSFNNNSSNSSEVKAQRLESAAHEFIKTVEDVSGIKKATLAGAIARHMVGTHVPHRKGFQGVGRIPRKTVEIDRENVRHELHVLAVIKMNCADNLAQLRRIRKATDAALDAVEEAYRMAMRMVDEKKKGWTALAEQLDAEIEQYQHEADEAEQERKTLETAYEAHERAAKMADENARLREQVARLNATIQGAEL